MIPKKEGALKLTIFFPLGHGSPDGEGETEECSDETERDLECGRLLFPRLPREHRKDRLRSSLRQPADFAELQQKSSLTGKLEPVCRRVRDSRQCHRTLQELYFKDLRRRGRGRNLC